MKKQQLIVWLLLFLVFINSGVLFSETSKPKLFIKFNGTTAFSSAGDFGDFMEKNAVVTKSVANNEPSRPNFRGYGGEIGFEMKRHSVGIGAGYIERYLDAGSRYSFSAIPIFLFIRYKLINGSFLKASVSLGEGVYLATYQEKMAETVLLKSKKNSLGFHGGLSLDFNIFKFLALFVDGGYRLVSFKGMVGKDYRNAGAPLEGDLYYQENASTGQYSFFIKQPKKNVPASRPAALNLNGFILSAGLKILL